jgi:transposase
MNSDLNNGVSCAQIAERFGMPEKTIRALKRQFGLPRP